MARIRFYIPLMFGSAIALSGGRQLGEYALRLMPLNFGERSMIAACVAMVALSLFLWMYQFVPGTLIPAERSWQLDFVMFYLGPLLAMVLTLYGMF